MNCKPWKKVYKCKSRWRRETIVCIYYFFFQYMHCKEAFTYAALDFSLTHSLLLLRQFVYPSYVLSICIAMSLRIAQCTSSSQQSVTGSIFQRPHGKKDPQNGHHRFGVNGHVEIQTFFPRNTTSTREMKMNGTHYIYSHPLANVIWIFFETSR